MRVDIAANTTGDEPFGHRLERREQWRERALALLHQVQHRAPRRPRAEPRQASELLNERLDSGGGHAQPLSLRYRLHTLPPFRDRLPELGAKAPSGGWRGGTATLPTLPLRLASRLSPPAPPPPRGTRSVHNTPSTP